MFLVCSSCIASCCLIYCSLILVHKVVNSDCVLLYTVLKAASDYNSIQYSLLCFDWIYLMFAKKPPLHLRYFITSRPLFSRALWFIGSQLDSLPAHTLPPIRYVIYIRETECASYFCSQGDVNIFSLFFSCHCTLRIISWNDNIYLFPDFKLSPCSVCCMLSFG